MVKGLILTERDKEILYDTYHSGCLTFRQMRGRHFKEKAMNTAHNRIQALKKGGYLVSTRVGIVQYRGAPQEIGVVYRATSKCITTLSRLYAREVFREKSVRLNTSSLQHDLLLVDVISVLKERLSNVRIVRPINFLGDQVQLKHTPDAFILDHEGHPNAAIELELTIKSKSRIRQIVLQYRLSPTIKKVIYVVGSEHIGDGIKAQISNQKRIPGLPAPSTDKFYFVTLSELLRQPKAVPITNGVSEFGALEQQPLTKGDRQWV